MQLLGKSEETLLMNAHNRFALSYISHRLKSAFFVIEKGGLFCFVTAPKSEGILKMADGAGLGGRAAGLGGCPNSLGGCPNGLGGCPSGLGGYPSGLGGCPDGMGGCPSSLGGCPPGSASCPPRPEIAHSKQLTLSITEY